MSRGELKVRFDSIEKRLGGIDARLDRMLPTDTFTLAIGHIHEEITKVDQDCRERNEDTENAVKELKENKQNSWMRWLQGLGIISTLAAAWLTAYLASKGMK